MYFVKKQCPGCVGMTKRSTASLQHCARIVLPAFRCSKGRCHLTICKLALWYRLQLLLPTATSGCLFCESGSQDKRFQLCRRLSLMVHITPHFLNSARVQMVFQNFVVPWKIHRSQKISLSADASQKDVLNGMTCLCKRWLHKGATTESKIMLKLLYISQFESIDRTWVNHPSTSTDTMCSGKHWYHTHQPGVHAQ